MPLRLSFAFCCLVIAAAVRAEGGVHIQPGQWKFVAERNAEIRALGMKKRDQGETLRCLSAEPLADLVVWLQAKGCQVREVAASPDGAQLTGECRFRFLPGQALPMHGSLQRDSATQFNLTLNAGRPGLSYQENTHATRTGDCPAGGA